MSVRIYRIALDGTSYRVQIKGKASSLSVALATEL